MAADNTVHYLASQTATVLLWGLPNGYLVCSRHAARWFSKRENEEVGFNIGHKPDE